MRSRHPPAEHLALPGADPNAAGEADVAHGAPVVRPDARLLEPVQVEVLDEPGEADRLVRRPPLVRVGAEDEVGACRGPRDPESRRVFLGRQPADLELHPGEATLAELADLLGDVLLAVVAADRDHRQAVPVAAPQPMQRLPERLADRVPDCGVDAGGGDEPEPPVAKDVEGGRAGELPAALDPESRPHRSAAGRSRYGRSRRSRAARRPRLRSTPRRRSLPRCGRG